MYEKESSLDCKPIPHLELTLLITDGITELRLPVYNHVKRVASG